MAFPAAMPAASQNIPEEEHEGYFTEALARVNENLVQCALHHLTFPAFDTRAPA